MPIIRRKKTTGPKRRRILTKPKLNYQFELFKIDNKSLSRFIFLKNRRKVSKTQITALKSLLYKAGHFNSPIVANEVESNYRIIDGNHRIEALKEVISQDPKYSIEVLLIRYKKLDEDGEIEAFRMWNIGRSQSIDDFIKSIADKVPFIRWLKKEFSIPVAVYSAPNKITVRKLCNAFIAAKKKDVFGSGMHKRYLAKELYDLTGEDYDYLNNFCREFSNVFGDPRTSNVYYKPSVFKAVMHIVYEHSEVNLWSRLRENVLGDEEIIELSNFSGRELNKKMIELIKNKLKLKTKL